MLSPRRPHHETVIDNRFSTNCLRLVLFVSLTSNVQAIGATPLGLPALDAEPQNARAALGAQLFFDPRLSVDGSMACSTCHEPDQAFTRNDTATSVGLDGNPLRRNAPTLLNVGYRQRLFHDGRENDLDRQAFSPLLAANEMGNPDLAAVLDRLAATAQYRQAFAVAFDDGINETNLGRALADYQRTLLSANSAFDRWYYGGEQEAMSSDAKSGFYVFSAAGCGDCHQFGHGFAHFTDDEMHRTGLMGPDSGLAEVTGDPADRYRFRTLTLRDVALTAPYMHDGRLATLMDVVTFYDRGGGLDAGGNPTLTPLNLSEGDKRSLIAFLESLTGG